MKSNLQINLWPIPAFNDNYIWLWSVPGKPEAWAVDPAEAAPLQRALAEHGLELAGIMVTHHHFDHVGGIADLLKQQWVPVYGPLNSPARECISHPVQEGDQLVLGGLNWEVMACPGHTLDHVAYYSPSAKALFCGDTLFSAGCGRLFEGSAEQMFTALQRFACLPDDTRVCCAHEYTLSNLKFARAAEPDNTAIIDYEHQCQQWRDNLLPTLPSTIATEKRVNPFMRANHAAELAERRAWKDRF